MKLCRRLTPEDRLVEVGLGDALYEWLPTPGLADRRAPTI
jgi:hypothetical protein